MSERRNPPPADGRRDEAPPWGEPAGYRQGPLQGTRFLSLLRERWWVPALTAALALGGAAAFLALRPPAYSSFARLRFTGKQTPVERNLTGEELRFSLGAEAGPLQREKLAQRTQARLLAANADPTPGPVRVSITQDPSAAVFIIEARGPEPAYTQAYLDAIIEDYLEARQQPRPKPTDDPRVSVSRLLAQQEQELKAAQARLADFQGTNNPALLQIQSTTASACLAKLNSQLSDLKLEALVLEEVRPDQAPGSPAGTNSMRSLPDAGPLAPAGFTPRASAAEYVAARQALQALQQQKAEFSRNLRPKHPKMQKLEDDIARAEATIERLRQQSRTQLTTAQQSLQGKIQGVEASLKEWDAKLVEANRGLAELDVLKANVQRAQTLYDGLLNRLQSAEANPSPDPELISVTEPATPALPVTPRWPLHLAAAGLAGLVVGLAILYFVAAFDDRIRSLAELGDRFSEAILGQVPETPRDRRTKQLKILDPDDARQMFAESYRNIRSSLVYLARSGTHPKLLLVTSAAPSEGKSTISVNLARALAFAGSRVLLIDADLRRGTLHERLGLPAEPGLTELLTLQPVAKNDTQSAAQLSVRTFAHEAVTTRSKLSPAIARALEQAVDLLDERLAQRIKKVMVPTAVPNLFFVPCGQFANNAADLFLSPGAEAFLKQVRDRFDYVIADSAPVFAADDTTSLAPRMDSVIFVVRHAFTGAGLAGEALDLLYQRQVNVLGLIFNRANPRSRKYHYYKYTSYYGSKKR